MKTLRQNTVTLLSDLQTPVGIYLKVRDLYPLSALLESSDYRASQNAVSYIGVEPIGSFKVIDGKIEKNFPGGERLTNTIDDSTDVADEMRRYVEDYTFVKADTEYPGGLLGYTAYDAVRYFEDVDIQPREAKFRAIPDIYYVLYRFLIRVDHYRSEMTIIENCPDGEESRISEIEEILHSTNVAQYPFTALDDKETNMTDAEFVTVVGRCIGHARRGDIFQVVPSRRFSQGFKGDEFNVYRALRCVNPSPYLFYFDFGSFRVLGSSPETHLRITGNTAYIDPIAGTFRRTGDEEHDRELAKALLADAKENAEHIMLVDLARNDLSRSGGTVEIDFLKQIQYYSHVIHMVSRVKTTLPPDTNRFRLFASTFPAGTLSGAPKVRAMSIINELEPNSRLLYGGCIGYIGFDGDMTQAITIRSFLSFGNRLYSQAGAGIVARSVPENELRETRNKLAALEKAIVYAASLGKQS